MHHRTNFDKGTYLCNPDICQGIGHSYIPRMFSCVSSQHNCRHHHLQQRQSPLWIFFHHRLVLPNLQYSCKYTLFCIWFLLLAMMFLRCIHDVVYISNVLFYCAVLFRCMNTPVFIHSPVGRHLSCFLFWIILSKTAKHILTWVFLWTYIFISLGKYPREELLSYRVYIY